MTKNRTKTLIFTTFDISQWKKLMIMRVFIAWILSICVLIMQVDILKKNGNKYLIFYSVDENKEVLKNMQLFGMELKQNKSSKWL